MPKRSASHHPIVPAAAKKPKKPKKAPAAAEPEAPPVAAPKPKKKKAKKVEQPAEQPAANGTLGVGCGALFTVTDGRAFVGRTGHDIAEQPDRADKAAAFLGWLLDPLEPDAFLRESFGKRPVLVSRADRAYYGKGWFSTDELRRQLRECSLRWTDEVDAARYSDGVRTTLNGEGVAKAADVWARYAEGCSIRLSWPQKHCDGLWGMLSLLEEHFGCMAGANVYATPAGSQGFAPHWDDIDAFVLQLEGEKRWRLYAPRAEEEALPRFSSPNLAQDELGELIGSVTLRPGELLYLPRGVVHQAVAGESDSLHLTVSIGRQHSWRDLLEFGMIGAIETLATENLLWRETLPPDYLDHMGVVNEPDDEEEEDDDGEGGMAGGAGWAHGAPMDEEAAATYAAAAAAFPDAAAAASRAAENAQSSAALRRRRSAISMRLRTMVQQLCDTLPIDAMCDQFACQRYFYDRLPPRFAPADAARMPEDPESLTLDSRIRLASRRAVRLVVEAGVAALYFCGHNPREHHALPEPHRTDFALEAAPAIQAVIHAYPKYVTVANLPGDDDAQRLDVAQALLEARAVLVRPPKGAEGAKKAPAATAASKSLTTYAGDIARRA